MCSCAVRRGKSAIVAVAISARGMVTVLDRGRIRASTPGTWGVRSGARSRRSESTAAHRDRNRMRAAVPAATVKILAYVVNMIGNASTEMPPTVPIPFQTRRNARRLPMATAHM